MRKRQLLVTPQSNLHSLFAFVNTLNTHVYGEFILALGRIFDPYYSSKALDFIAAEGSK
jgi:hypothetical protein